jgi:hypothetical protein
MELEADYRRHAEIENVIRDLKYGLGLNHLPSGKFAANAAWLACNVIADNLCCWLTRLAGLGIQCLKTLRRRLFSVPGRLVRSARHNHLKTPSRMVLAGAVPGCPGHPSRCFAAVGHLTARPLKCVAPRPTHRPLPLPEFSSLSRPRFSGNLGPRRTSPTPVECGRRTSQTAAQGELGVDHAYGGSGSGPSVNSD